MSKAKAKRNEFKKLRVLVLVHEDLVPPESMEGYSDKEIQEWKTEFDVVSTLAEEAKTPRTLVPTATVLALVVYAVLIIVGMWALTLGGDPKRLWEAAKDDRMPINDVAETFWGHGKALVALTAHAIKGDREKALESGFQAYVTKPIDEDLLFETVEKFRKA